MSEPKEAALLLRIEGGEIKQRWSLAAPVTTIGRWQDNDLVVDDRWVSRHHARVRREGDQYLIEDLGSKNGTLVNGRRISGPTLLADGDEIQVSPLVPLTFVGYASTAPLPFEPGPASLAFDLTTRDVRVRGRVLDPPLSQAQFTLLALLAEEPGRVYSRDEVIAVVWSEAQAEGVSDEAIDAMVRRIRLRLRELDPGREHIVTMRGYGFTFEPG
ncbi:MAG: FHA domain-containing protein [Chloroflexi bacterium]|nr:MAG: FHA domain-containing protein [Chloroflexota bacterium]